MAKKKAATTKAKAEPKYSPEDTPKVARDYESLRLAASKSRSPADIAAAEAARVAQIKDRRSG